MSCLSPKPKVLSLIFFGLKTFDSRLLKHRERAGPGGAKVFFEADSSTLPDGCFIEYDNKPQVIFKGLMFPWSPTGYQQGTEILNQGTVKVITPASIVNTFRAGYSRR